MDRTTQIVLTESDGIKELSGLSYNSEIKELMVLNNHGLSIDFFQNQAKWLNNLQQHRCFFNSITVLYNNYIITYVLFSSFDKLYFSKFSFIELICYLEFLRHFAKQLRQL